MLTDSQKNAIQSAYSTFTQARGFRPRYGQKVMIAEIAKYLASIEADSMGRRSSPDAVCVVEAGTGTGKTLAYCLSVLPLALEQQRKVIVSTATTALQEQIIDKDLPDIAQHAGLTFDFALAKGRGRYICLSRLDVLLATFGGDTATLPMFALDTRFNLSDPTRLNAFLNAYARGQWDGDRDRWPGEIDPLLWQNLTVDNASCANRRCSYFHNCPYYEARKQWDEVDLIVTNHDLLLSDLALGGGVLLPPVEQSILVLDEAHHLADKALDHFMVSGGLHSTELWLKSLSKSLADFLPHLAQGHSLTGAVDDLSATMKQIAEHTAQVYDDLGQGIPWQEGDNLHQKRFRFELGHIPEALLVQAQQLHTLWAAMYRRLDEIRNEVGRAVDDKSDCGLGREESEQWFPVFGGLAKRAEAWLELWQFYARETGQQKVPDARWLIWHAQDEKDEITLFGSPLTAADSLHELLWSRCYAAIMTSATLTALGRFERLANKAGLPAASVFHCVPSPFDFRQVATLSVPDMRVEPTDAEAHTREVVERLPEIIGDDRAVLVLFSSRRQMNDVCERVAPSLRTHIVTQDAMNKQELVRHHRACIDAGGTSILFGLASLAEGIDLPGCYLTLVVIAKLPFAVPNDPLEQSISEWLESQGRNPFMEVSVPEASLKLIQACGRLIRTEQDRGRIVILDKRLNTRHYGRMILDSLPPFRRV
jgi:ATP-dependent DNA helicase DinG